MTQRLLNLVVLIALIGLTACGGTEEPTDLGPPFFPDDRGIVTEISLDRIQLEGSRNFPISSFVRSFSTYQPDEALPILNWKNRYVHLGLDESKTAIWIAGIGVVDTSVDPPIVFYTNGAIKELDGNGNLIFEDGTVFKLDKGVSVPDTEKRVTLMIDARAHRVIRIVEQPQ